MKHENVAHRNESDCMCRPPAGQRGNGLLLIYLQALMDLCTILIYAVTEAIQTNKLVY